MRCILDLVILLQKQMKDMTYFTSVSSILRVYISSAYKGKILKGKLKKLRANLTKIFLLTV